MWTNRGATRIPKVTPKVTWEDVLSSVKSHHKQVCQLPTAGVSKSGEAPSCCQMVFGISMLLFGMFWCLMQQILESKMIYSWGFIFTFDICTRPTKNFWGHRVVLRIIYIKGENQLFENTFFKSVELFCPHSRTRWYEGLWIKAEIMAHQLLAPGSLSCALLLGLVVRQCGQEAGWKIVMAWLSHSPVSQEWLSSRLSYSFSLVFSVFVRFF